MQPSFAVVPLIVLGYLLAAATSSQIQAFGDASDNMLSSNSGINPQQQQQHQQQLQQPQLGHLAFQKRPSERYGFGLGRRASYTSGNSGVKRLPVYNFGLGKRGGGGDLVGYGTDEMYPFLNGMMGKGDDSQENLQLSRFDAWLKNMPQREMGQALDAEASEKRARPYNFGLGKRLARIEENSIERRGGDPLLYNFGLGRR